jgi:hypothetical protein
VVLGAQAATEMLVRIIFLKIFACRALFFKLIKIRLNPSTLTPEFAHFGVPKFAPPLADSAQHFKF